MNKRSWNESVLRVMLDKLDKGELINTMISIFNTVAEKDEDIEQITHVIVTYVQVKEIILGRDKLENYKEPHRTELQEELKKLGWKPLSINNLMMRLTKKE